MRILVVEDEPLLAMLLEESVTELGHEVAGAAATVEQAMALLDEGTVELALLDFSLGQQTTSVPVAVRLRERGIPFLYLSGHRSLGEEGNYPPAPLLTKPFSLDQLDAAIRRLPLAA
jgi:DNA-binding response OmpR family regulator